MISLVKLLRAGASPVNPQVNPDRKLLSLPSPSRCGHRWLCSHSLKETLVIVTLKL